MYPAVHHALNNDHIATLHGMSRPTRRPHSAKRRVTGKVRNAAGSKLIALGQRIAARPPLSPAGR